MTPKVVELSRKQLLLAYVGGGVLAFIIALYITFPYDALKERVQQEAQKNGIYLRARSAGPALFGVKLRDVEVRTGFPAADTETPPPSLRIQAIAVRPALFPPGVAFSADFLGGSVSGSIGGLGTIHVDLEAEDLDPSQGSFKEFAGVDAEGRLSAELSLAIPKTQVPGGKLKEPDLSVANGEFAIALEKVVIKGGNVSVPMYGTMTPMDLPRIVLGNLEGKVKFKDGAGTLEKLAGKSEDLELQGQGTIGLAKRAQYAKLDLQLKLKTEPAFVQRLGMVGAAVSILPPDPQNPAFRTARIGGTLSSPHLIQ